MAHTQSHLQGVAHTVTVRWTGRHTWAVQWQCKTHTLAVTKREAETVAVWLRVTVGGIGSIAAADRAPKG